MKDECVLILAVILMASLLVAYQSPWISSSSTISLLTHPSSNYYDFKYQSRPSPFHGAGGLYCSASLPQYAMPDLHFVLHDALDSNEIDTTHAKEARKGFMSEIDRLSIIERQTSISINRRVDLAKTALYIAAEDDSLVSHSSVPLPVKAFMDRLDDLCTGYLSFYHSSHGKSPELFLEHLERYLYVKKVLTHRSGSLAMLSLIYSETVKLLRRWTLVDFDCEIFFPHDFHSLPRGYHKLKSKESDQSHIMTTQMLLKEILTNLKEAFWPFQLGNATTLFLSAAEAANCTDRSNVMGESGFQLASAKAAQHRLERGVWTSVRFGDMRRALAACERLILLRTDLCELRDYSVLLYHCGFYEQSLQYLNLYQETKSSCLERKLQNKISKLEEVAVERLMARLNLIAMETGWSKSAQGRNFFSKNSEPW